MTPTAAAPAVDAAAILALTESPPGYDPDWWRGALPRFTGGLPGGRGRFADAVDAIRQLAAAAVPSPVHNGVVQSGALLAALGEREHLNALTAGERRYAFCVTEPDGSYGPGSIRTRAEPTGKSWRLDGTKCFVPYAADADVLLVVARVPGPVSVADGRRAPDVVAAFAVDAAAPGVRIEPIPTIGLDHQCAISLRAAPARRLGAFRRPGRPPDPTDPTDPTEPTDPTDSALSRGTIALAADALGAAEAAMRYAVERVSTRVQQGTPLGTRQAVKHRCADMLLDVALVAGVVERAARLLDRDAAPDDVRRAAAIAKAAAATRCRRVTASAHQLCGGDGIHADRPLHLWYRRVKAAEPMLGDPRHHRATVATTLLDSSRSEGFG
ncbi:acyl-CoA dehydrogenase family protein [Cryptosporangium aurantiacum]|uniref:Acyl-CoA dehydrogenase n=1 Tax=Cryptosporangium aurantiacum TaxID=134849 RepID=A0A1M7RJP5_9ACTN|nr:acyl-CoA dehydrogenase family protein [Cryptosporangium aurantiacum]SHN46565.1 Acyl-CoA dehydrogenase [Cryptosporangium aurantiacum]